MKVIVIAWPGEGEYDIFLGCRQKGIDIEMFFVHQGNIKGYIGGLPGTGGDPPHFTYTLITPQQVGATVDNNFADLYLFKYPQHNWTRPVDMRKVVCWNSEQGVTKRWAEAAAQPYGNVGINSRLEQAYFKAKYPQKNIFYLPFGCYDPGMAATATPSVDLISDGRYPSMAGSEMAIRLQSAHTMVTPVLDYDIALYGAGYQLIPNIGSRYKGLYDHWKYPSIYATGKIYLGITWNWKHGGFGIKLARAMSCGIPVIWHNSPGMELEGWEKGKQLDWSSSPAETKDLVDYYLSHEKERLEMGWQGQKWAFKHWHWGTLLEGIAKQL